MKVNSITGMVIVLIIVLLGWVGFSTLKESISSPTTSSQMNTTMSVGNSVYNIIGIVFLLGAACLILGFLFYWVSSPERFKKPNKLIKFLSTSLYYFGFGCLGLTIIAIPAYLAYFMYTYTIVEGNAGAMIDIIKWILIGIVAFFGIAGFGYVFKKKFVDKLNDRLTEKEYEKNIKELPKGE